VKNGRGGTRIWREDHHALSMRNHPGRRQDGGLGDGYGDDAQRECREWAMKSVRKVGAGIAAQPIDIGWIKNNKAVRLLQTLPFVSSA